MKKKILKYSFMLILCFTFVFLFMPKESFAANGDWIYDSEAKTLTNSEDDQLVIGNVTAEGTNLAIGDNRKAGFTSIDLTGEIKDSSNTTTNYAITSIGHFAFYQCASLNEINIPNSVISIGEYAFSGCNALKEINIPYGVISIGNYACYNSTYLEKISISDSVTSIGMSAFGYCTSLKEINIPDSVTSIGSSAFESCMSLKTITLPDSVTSIANWTFNGCIALEEINIPDSVTSIGISAFSGCNSLSGITIPDSVTSIGSSVFAFCSSLNEIIIPDSITSIGSSAFAFCSSLNEIIIPDSITSINSSTFSGCTSLNTIYLMSETPVSLGDNVFLYCSSLSNIYVPFSSVDLYKEEWSNYENLIKAGIYKLTVENGNGSGNYIEGADVSISADNNENGHFTLWQITSGNGVSLTDEKAAKTTFKMPNSDVTVTAVFEAHNYVNGKCSVCGYEDPDYLPPKEDGETDNSNINNDSVSTDTKVNSGADKTASSSVDTSDENNVTAYFILLMVSIIMAGSLSIYKNKKGC